MSCGLSHLTSASESCHTHHASGITKVLQILQILSVLQIKHITVVMCCFQQMHYYGLRYICPPTSQLLQHARRSTGAILSRWTVALALRPGSQTSRWIFSQTSNSVLHEEQSQNLWYLTLKCQRPYIPPPTDCRNILWTCSYFSHHYSHWQIWKN